MNYKFNLNNVFFQSYTKLLKQKLNQEETKELINSYLMFGDDLDNLIKKEKIISDEDGDYYWELYETKKLNEQQLKDLNQYLEFLKLDEANNFGLKKDDLKELSKNVLDFGIQLSTFIDNSLDSNNDFELKNKILNLEKEISYLHGYIVEQINCGKYVDQDQKSNLIKKNSDELDLE